MDREQIANIKNWFSGYVDTFKEGDPEMQENIKLKEDHTRRVCREILKIGKKLGLNDDELRLAEIIALLHDVGRFEQYARYGTFKDGKSENHAELGIRILEEKGILKHFDDTIQYLIIRSIRYHNRASLPTDENETCLFYSKLLRDADKLDIWKVVTDYYHRKDGKKNTALELELPDTPGISREVYNDLLNKRAVKTKNIHNLNDFKLLQAGWIFDINFKPSLDMAKERHYLEKIRTALPESNEIDEVYPSYS
ncbi:MAG: HD domain-containing protein [Bacteroidota bacterium]|nr:HD domain-containing protein [Bacteroidota bacterium]